MNDTLRGQGLDPADPSLPAGIFERRAFGAKVAAAGLTSASALKLTGSKLTKVDVVATLLTLAPADAPTATSWLDTMATVHSTSAQSAVQAPCPGPGGAAANGRDCASNQLHCISLGL